MNDVETIAKPMTEEQLVRHLIEGKGHGSEEVLRAYLDEVKL